MVISKNHGRFEFKVCGFHLCIHPSFAVSWLFFGRPALHDNDRQVEHAFNDQSDSCKRPYADPRHFRIQREPDTEHERDCGADRE